MGWIDKYKEVIPKAQKGKLVSNKDFETPPEGFLYPKEWQNWWLDNRSNTVRSLAKEAGIPSEGIIEKAKNKINTLPEYKIKDSSPNAYYLREGKIGKSNLNSHAAYVGYNSLIPLSVGIHEPTHGISDVLPEELEEVNISNIVNNATRTNNPELKKYFKDKDYYYKTPWEVKARLNEFRYLYGLDPKRNYTVDDIKNIINNPPNREFLEKSRKGSRGADDLLNMFTPEEILELHNKTVLNKSNNLDKYILPKAQYGGVIKDNAGYWNKNNWGKPVEIDSNNITMRGVREPLLGISNTGDVQYMSPGNDYKFKGNKVTEIPVAQEGTSLKQKLVDRYKKEFEGLSFTEQLKKLNSLIPIIKMIPGGESLLKEEAYRIGSQSKIASRYLEDILDTESRSLYKGQNINSDINRDLLRLALYDDTLGFNKVPENVRKDIKIPLTDSKLNKESENYLAYWLAGQYSSGDSIPYNNILETTKSLINRNRRNKKLSEFKEPYLTQRADSILQNVTSGKSIIYSQFPYDDEKKVEDPYEIYDNLAGYSARIRRDPKTGGLWYDLNDIWDWDSNYGSKYSNDKETVGEQAKALSSVTKPFYLMASNPIEKKKKQGGQIKKFQEGNKVIEIPIAQEGKNINPLISPRLSPQGTIKFLTQTFLNSFLANPIKRRIYNTVLPGGYPEDAMNDAIKNFKEGKSLKEIYGEGYVPEVDREIFGYSLGVVPKKNLKYWEPSPYISSVSNNKNSNIRLKPGVLNKSEISSDIESLISSGKSSDIYHAGKYMNNEYSVLDPISNYTLSLGQDEKGKYAEMYDIYDFDNPMLDMFLENPQNVVDRFYYEEDPKTKKIKIKQQGGQIKSNAQMKNQEVNLQQLQDFSNFGKKMKTGGWLDKFND